MKPVEEIIYFFCVAEFCLTRCLSEEKKRKATNVKVYFGYQESITKRLTNLSYQYLNMENSMQLTKIKSNLEQVNK